MLFMGMSLSAVFVYAAAFNDAATGNWNIGTTWGGACAVSCTEGTDYPGINDTATIDSHTVTLSADHSVSDVTIGAGGTLSAGSNRLIVDGAWSNTGGTFSAATSTVIFSSTDNETIDPDNDAFNDVVINDGLIIYMKFDETSANTCSGGVNDACDSSGFGRDGTWNGTAASNTAIPTLNFPNLRSVDLDGDSDYVAINSPQLPTGDFTYAAWINVDSTSDEMIVMSPNSGGQNELIFRVSSGRLNTFTNNTSRMNSTSTLSTNVWTHVAVTRSGSTIRHYINGIQDATTANDAGVLNFDTCPVYIGTDVDSGCSGGLGNYYDGQIDEWRAYNRALTTAEIATLANGDILYLSGATFTLQDQLDIDGDIYLNSGVLDVDSTNNYGVTLAGDWVNQGGVFMGQQGTVTLDGGAQNIVNDETFYNLAKTISTASTITFTADATVTIDGTLKLEGASGQLLGLGSDTPGTRFELDITDKDQVVNFVRVRDSETSTFSVVAVNSTNDGGNDDGESIPHWDFNLPVNIGGTVYTDEGVTNIGSGITVAISINGAAAAATDVTDANGDYGFTGISTVPGDILTIYIDGETEKAVTVVAAGVGNKTDVDLYENHLIVRSEFGAPVTNTNLATADNNGDADITGAYSISAGNLTVSAGYDLYIWPGDNVFTPGGTVTTPDLDVYGDFDIEANDFSVTSTLIVGDGGTLDLSGGQTITTSTVNINSGSTVIYRGDDDTAADTYTITTLSSTYHNLIINSDDGDTDEYQLGANLTVNGTLSIPSGTWDFNTNDASITGNWTMGVSSQNVAAGLAGIDVTVGGDMTLTGESGDLIDLNVGSVWTLDVTGVGQASYVDVQNSNASGGSEIIAFDGTNTNSGGNTNWNFVGAILSGTVFTDEGTTNIGAAKTVAVSINGAAASGTDDTDASGNYSISGLNYVAGDILTVYLDGEPEQALAVLEAQSGSQSGVDLYQDRLIVRQLNTGSITNTDFATADNNGDTDITDFYTMNGTILTMASDKEMYIWSGTTYAPGAATTLGDIDINGVFTMGSNSIFVDGSWDATGGSFTSSGQVMLTSTNTETITSNGQSFNDLTLNDGLVGYWKFDEGTGSTALDHSGYNRHGTYFNVDAGDWVTPVPVNFANTYSLDINTTSTDEYVTIPNTTIDGLGDITAAFWMRTTRTGNAAVISGANASSNNEYLIFFTSDTAPSFYAGAGNVTWTITSIADNVWHHVMMVRDDANNQVNLYIDGVADDENPQSLTMSTVSIDDGGLMFAQEQDSVGGGFDTGQIFVGTLDEMRIYNRVLGAAEASRLANGDMPNMNLGMYTLQDDLDVNGTLGLFSGELDVDVTNDRTVNLNGNWLNFGGAFDEHQGTVILDGTDQDIPAGETFYNLQKVANSADTLTVGQSSTITISNTLTMFGTGPARRLQLRSSTPGTRFDINVTAGDQSTSFLDVQDSEASSNDITAQFSINSGGNDDAETTPFWIFPPYGPKRGAIMMVE